MSNLSDRVDIQISRETSTPSVASFGTPAIIAEFATSKTSPAFDRTRIYSSTAEMIADGWLTTDEVYKRAQIIFQQNPKVSYIRIGRKNPETEDWTAALTAIKIDSDDWFAFDVICTEKGLITISGDYVTGSTIVATINGTAVPGVSWTTDMQHTMGALKTAIESAITGAKCTVGATPFRTMTIELDSGNITSASFVSTGGATNPTSSATYTVSDDVLEVAAWAEEEKKIYFLTAPDTDIPTSSTGDIFSQLKALNYDNTVLCYHPTSSLFGSGWIGECMPFNFPTDSAKAQSWDCKTIKGIAAYALTSSQRGYIVGATNTDNGKCGNIYTTTAGIDNTEKGICASGESIEVIAGIYWLEARIAENVFTEKVQSRIIPMTNPGIQVIEGRVREILELGVANGLIKKIVSLTVPDESAISDADLNAGLLEGVEFEIQLARAIKKTVIKGRVTA